MDRRPFLALLVLGACAVLPACSSGSLTVVTNAPDGAIPDGATSAPDGATSVEVPGTSPAAGKVPLNHRADGSQCSAPVGPGACQAMGNGSFACLHDTDCTGTNARCETEAPAAFAGCKCTSDTCNQDTDCPTGSTCACHGSFAMFGNGNTCLPSNCRVDSDCGANGYCSPTPSGGCGLAAGYYCHTAMDECVDSSDCPTSSPNISTCIWGATQARWVCTSGGPCA